MGGVVTSPAAPSAPTVATPQALTFNGSVSYQALTGGCSFLDFNWVQLFTSTSELVPLYITPVSNPTGMVAKVLGVPTATVNGIMYDTIRLVKVADHLAPGVYVFTFRVSATNGLSSNVTLNLTVV